MMDRILESIIIVTICIIGILILFIGPYIIIKRI